MLGYVSAEIPCNSIWNLELKWSCKALQSDLVLQFATTHRNTRQRESSFYVDSIMKQLPLQNEVSLTGDWWISTHRSAITSVIAYNMCRNWAVGEVQLAFVEVDRLFFSTLQSYLMIVGQGPTYWSKARCTFEGLSWSFWAYQWLFAGNYAWWRVLKLLDESWAAIHPWGLRNRVAFIEEPHTMHGARHIAGFRCIHEQSGCKRQHQVVGSPWAWSAIWREWMHGRWEESMTSKRRQC